MTWFDTDSGYQVRLADNGKVVCRNPKGKELTSVPAALKDDARVVQLRQLAEWLTRHEAECLATVDRWMVRSLPVPLTVLTEVWPDPAWQGALRDLVVVADDETGFLRDADPERGLGLVNLDGDTVRRTPTAVTIPHPALLGEETLDELREFGAELGVDQQVQQLYRLVAVRPDDVPEGADSVGEFENGKFEQLRFVQARCRTLGYQVRGGFAVHPVYENDQVIEARYWIGEGDPAYETYTGALTWCLPDGTTLSVLDVTPVAWSEGVRMAATLFDERVVEDEAA
nr:DUF4132 domain-containing protein [Kibdelosporangium sp. MJ126-NF4]CEL15478.1 hypothetical protein [Kibdelosporangium sp. MJ126-NF4]CTQ92120.1 hypothetical protein [Kibdelosporangium sp. MJ126-NF4]